MTSQDAPPRRSRRAKDQKDAAPTADPEGAAPTDETPATPDAGASRTGALAWVDPQTFTPTAPIALGGVTAPSAPVGGDLLAGARMRSPLRPGVVTPILLLMLLVAAYAATTLLWPLHAVAPTITAVQVSSAAAPAAAPAWPAAGSASVAVAGIGEPLASATDARAIASITKVVTALVVLDAQPLAVGEQGPAYRITSADRAQYFNDLSNNESALNVPVGGTLSQYQLLQGMLIGSAGNYAEKLADAIWPNDRVFASAARTWMDAHGVTGITIVEPTGIDRGNSAAPASLIALAERAMANPVIAEIVRQPSVTLPGAGLVENTNGLLADPGVIGIKTGSLDTYNLLAAKDVAVGDTNVRLYAATLGQPDDATRITATGALFAELQKELQPTVAVPADTVVAQVETLWGTPVDIVTAADAPVILWNGGTALLDTTYDLGDRRTAGDVVGLLTASGTLDSSSADLTLASDIDPPDAWWRLTHPLDLFGLNG